MQAVLLFTLVAVGISANINDPDWNKQWYLNPKNGNEVHLNVQPAWDQGIKGHGIRVAVVDTGVNDNGGDLSVAQRIDDPNWRGGVSWNTWATRGHGTLAAGVIAAKPNNMCGVGVAPEVSLWDIPLFGQRSPTNQQKGEALKKDLSIDIYSNSWGTFDSGIALTDLAPEVDNALIQGTTHGRGGKGAVYIWASGNGGNNDDSCAYDAYVNSRYTIAVTGVDREGRKLRTGEACEAIMAAAPSRNSQDSIASAIVTPNRDGGRGCQYSFSESSVAAPMAAGAVALLLQKRPDLGWRDVQHIIAQTCDPTVFKEENFPSNKANFKYSRQFGFGLLNAGEMVKIAPEWQKVGRQFKCTGQVPVKGLEVQFYMRDMTCEGRINYIEHLIIKLNVVNKWYRGSITGKVTSPSGTTSDILTGRSKDLLPLGLKNWPVKTLRFWGESMRPNRQPWKVAFEAINTDAADSHVTLEVYGVSSGPKRLSHQTGKNINSGSNGNIFSCSFNDATCGMKLTAHPDGFEWRRNKGKTSSDFTGPSSDRLGSKTGGYLYTEASPSSASGGNVATAITPYVDVGGPSCCLEFSYHMFGKDMGKLNVYSQQKGSKFPSRIFDKSGDQGNRWIRFKTAISGISNEIQFVFEGIRGKGFLSDAAIDDVVIHRKPCH